VSELRSELLRPAANGLIADLDTPRGQHFFDFAKAQGEPEIKPHGMPDDVGRKPVPLE
jgi:hypothetical protein